MERGSVRPKADRHSAPTSSEQDACRPSLTGGATPLVHVTSIRAVDSSAVPTFRPIRTLKVIRARNATMSGTNLAVPVHRADLDRSSFTASPLAVLLRELNTAQ